MASSPKLAVIAAACMLMFLFLPLVYVSGTVMGISTGGSSMSGSQMAGWTAWFGFLAFVAAAASRYVPQLAQYRLIIDIAAFVMVAVVVIYLFVASPIATAAQQVSQMQNQFSGLMAGVPGRPSANMPAAASFSIVPHIGVLFLIVAPIALFLAKRRERAAVPVI